MLSRRSLPLALTATFIVLGMVAGPAIEAQSRIRGGRSARSSSSVRSRSPSRSSRSVRSSGSRIRTAPRIRSQTSRSRSGLRSSSRSSRSVRSPSSTNRRSSDVRRTTPRIRQGSTPTIRRGSTPTIRRGSTPTIRRGSTPTIRRGSTPTIRRGSTPTIRRGTSPTIRRGSRLGNRQPPSRTTGGRVERGSTSSRTRRDALAPFRRALIGRSAERDGTARDTPDARREASRSEAARVIRSRTARSRPDAARRATGTTSSAVEGRFESSLRRRLGGTSAAEARGLVPTGSDSLRRGRIVRRDGSYYSGASLVSPSRSAATPTTVRSSRSATRVLSASAQRAGRTLEERGSRLRPRGARGVPASIPRTGAASAERRESSILRSRAARGVPLAVPRTPAASLVEARSSILRRRGARGVPLAEPRAGAPSVRSALDSRASIIRPLDARRDFGRIYGTRIRRDGLYPYFHDRYRWHRYHHRFHHYPYHRYASYRRHHPHISWGLSLGFHYGGLGFWYGSAYPYYSAHYDPWWYYDSPYISFHYSTLWGYPYVRHHAVYRPYSYATVYYDYGTPYYRPYTYNVYNYYYGDEGVAYADEDALYGPEPLRPEGEAEAYVPEEPPAGEAEAVPEAETLPPPDGDGGAAREAFVRGLEAFRAGRFEEAAEAAYEAMNAADGRLPRLFLALTLEALGEHATAASVLRVALTGWEEFPRYRWDLAAFYGDEATAREHLRRLEDAVGRRPQDPDLHLLRLVLLVAHGRPGEARSSLPLVRLATRDPQLQPVVEAYARVIEGEQPPAPVAGDAVARFLREPGPETLPELTAP